MLPIVIPGNNALLNNRASSFHILCLAFDVWRSQQYVVKNEGGPCATSDGFLINGLLEREFGNDGANREVSTMMASMRFRENHLNL